MQAKIYQPARNAMTSGQAKTKNWVLEYTPAQRRSIDPLMGWTSSGDMDSQVRLTFASKDDAIEYAREHGLAFTVSEPHKRKLNVRPGGYGENFATNRRGPWTH